MRAQQSAVFVAAALLTVGCSTNTTTAAPTDAQPGGVARSTLVQADIPATLASAAVPTPPPISSAVTIPTTSTSPTPPSTPTPSTTTTRGSTTTLSPEVAGARTLPLKLVAAARSQVGITTGYDPAYRDIPFPNGDVPIETGVCSDVVVRALRGLGIDLQERINTDMRANFGAYPRKWGASGPDSNIDHRRVGNIERYFERRDYALPITDNSDDYRPGDIASVCRSTTLAS